MLRFFCKPAAGNMGVANLGVMLQFRCLAAFRLVMLSFVPCAGMLSGFRTLPLLCKTTQRLPIDVVQLVQKCLYLDLGKRCPAWVDILFRQQLQHFGMESEVIFTVCAVRHINRAHDWAWLNMPSSDFKDEDASVTVKITVYPGGILWDLECKQNNALVLQNCGMSLDSHTWQPSILACLRQSRKSFSCPHTEPIGTLEVPSRLHEWRALFRQWLFSGACAEADTTCDICILTPPWCLSD